VHDAAAEVQPALHAAAESLDGLPRAIAQADALERFEHASLQPVADQATRHPSARFSPRSDPRIARGPAGRRRALTRCAAVGDDIVAEHGDAAGRRRQQPEMQPIVVDLPAPFGPTARRLHRASP
jgi:hypothetical protein